MTDRPDPNTPRLTEEHSADEDRPGGTAELAPERLLRQTRRGMPPFSPPAENVPPRPSSLFRGLFEQQYRLPRPTDEPQSVQDQDAASEMLTSLIHTLQTPAQHTPAILQHALIGLGRAGSAAEHLPIVAPFLDQRWDQPVRLAGVRAISNLGGEAAVDALIGLLNDADIAIRWEAQAALDRLLTAASEVPSTEQDSTQVTPVQSAPAEIFDDLPS